MNSIPLIKGNTPQEINTSIIALKKALDNLQATSSEDLQKRIDEINAQIETINQQITDLQPIDSITSGNMHAVTSNAVANSNAMPVDTVTSGDMHSITSNAVSTLLKKYTYTISSVTLSVMSYDEFSISTSNIPISVNGYTYISYNIQQGNTDAILYNLRVRDNQWRLTMFNSAKVTQTVSNITINVYFYINT